MEDADFLEKDYCYATTFALADLCAEANKKCFDVLPGDVRASWMGEDCFQGSLMRALHALMVLHHGTERNTSGF